MRFKLHVVLFVIVFLTFRCFCELVDSYFDSTDSHTYDMTQGSAFPVSGGKNHICALVYIKCIYDGAFSYVIVIIYPNARIYDHIENRKTFAC